MTNIITLLEKRITIILFLSFLITLIYIFYLNFMLFELKNLIKSKDNLYSIQINNRIEEILELNEQITDLHKLLNIGLNINNKENVYFNTKLDEKDKINLLFNIPSGLPLKNIHITSRYGQRTHPITKLDNFHTGIDLKTNLSESVFSTADGVVLKVRNDDTGGYGKFIIILHNYGFSTLYAHLEQILIKEGDFISKNTLIGYSGNTGNSTGPHLHYEVQFLQKHINPIDFLYWNLKTFDTLFNNKYNIDWEDMFYLVKKNNDS